MNCIRCGEKLHHRTLYAGNEICAKCRINKKERKFCKLCNEKLDSRTSKKYDTCVRCRANIFLENSKKCSECGKLLHYKTIKTGEQICFDCRKAKKYYCENCGKEITGRGKSNYCSQCYLKLNLNKKRKCLICDGPIDWNNKSGICYECSLKEYRSEFENGTEFIDYVVCPYCRQKMKQSFRHINRIHNKTIEEIRIDFPDIILESKKCRDKVKDHGKVCINCGKKIHNKNHKKLCKDCRIICEICGTKICGQGISNRCRICSGSTGKDTIPELKVENLFKDMKIRFEKQKYIERKFYDFYLYDYNILIEVDGVYWHHRDKNHKIGEYKYRIKNDLFKDKLAKKNGYRIVRIWEDEIDKMWLLV